MLLPTAQARLSVTPDNLLYLLSTGLIMWMLLLPAAQARLSGTPFNLQYLLSTDVTDLS